MTYNEVVEYFKAICLDINPNGSFIHGRRVDGSIEYDAPMPQIHLYPFTSQPDFKNNNSISSMVICFWQMDALGNTLDKRQEIISDMDVLCTAFLQRLESDAVGGVLNARTEPQYLTLSATLSGYALTFNFTHTLAC